MYTFANSARLHFSNFETSTNFTILLILECALSLMCFISASSCLCKNQVMIKIAKLKHEQVMYIIFKYRNLYILSVSKVKKIFKT